MDGDRAMSLLADPDQWARCRHEDTALMPCGGIQLTWDDAPTTDSPAAPPAGLAFDRWGRAYRSRPAEDRIEVIRADRTETLGGCPGLFDGPRGLAVDTEQRLYVAEVRAARVTVYDIWADRILRRVSVRGRAHRSARPVDAAAVGERAYVLLHHPAGIVVFHGRRSPLPGPRLSRPRCRERLAPERIATRPDGTPLVLWRRAGTPYALVATVSGEVVAEVPGATDFDVTEQDLLVVARAPERVAAAPGPEGASAPACARTSDRAAAQPFQRLEQQGASRLELEPVAAAGYDGGAVASASDGTFAFTTAAGIGRVGGPETRHRTSGRVITYRLDSGTYRTRWGRLFLDACIPPRTDVHVGFLTSDDDAPPGDALPWQPADRGSGTIRRPDLTPPLPSAALLGAARAPGGRPVLRRPDGRETPWAQIPANDRFETYETAVLAEPGRYLWVVLELTSATVAATPRVRALRVERPGHQILRQLPRTWSRDDGDADFLQRFLAPAEGMLHELDERAARRELLVDPAAVPQEAMTWLAGFAGLTLDRRWPEDARRSLIASAYRLFRRRGTLGSLTELLGIYLGHEPVIIEQWRLRGVPGVVLGGVAGRSPDDEAAPVLGRLRASGTLGDAVLSATVRDDIRPGDDGYRTAAHRFSVLIHAGLSAEQLAVVRTILELHKPAHTTYEICELGCGMRVGRQLHIGLTSVVGPGAQWGPAVLGQVAVGGDGVVGVPTTGAVVQKTSVVGEVRVG
ncbi:phage tail protein [Streptomyces sp. NPDC005374]|uniref:phage tail protein n=1 Tax=Streptomyces sp. NPDC005374 TaxID=3364713 RepID=UPI0036AA2078